jgi:hypothetical protein
MKIIVWKLGSLEHKIFPTEAAILKLKDMLLKLRDDKTSDIKDLIYGPDLTVEEVDMDNLEDCFIQTIQDGKQVLIPISRQIIDNSYRKTLEDRLSNLESKVEYVDEHYTWRNNDGDW